MSHRRRAHLALANGSDSSAISVRINCDRHGRIDRDVADIIDTSTDSSERFRRQDLCRYWCRLQTRRLRTDSSNDVSNRHRCRARTAHCMRRPRPISCPRCCRAKRSISCALKITRLRIVESPEADSDRKCDAGHASCRSARCRNISGTSHAVRQ